MVRCSLSYSGQTLHTSNEVKRFGLQILIFEQCLTEDRETDQDKTHRQKIKLYTSSMSQLALAVCPSTNTIYITAACFFSFFLLAVITR